MHWLGSIKNSPKRFWHAVAVVNSTIYSVGSASHSSLGQGRPINIDTLNPVTNRWSRLSYEGSDAPIQTGGHTVVAHKHYLYMWGGIQEGLIAGVMCPTLFRFNTRTKVWDAPEVGGTPPLPRTDHFAVVIRNAMLIWGGFGGVGAQVSDDIYALNLNTLTWSKWHVKGEHPPYYLKQSITPYQDRYIFTLSTLRRQGEEDSSPTTLSRFDVETKSWSPVRTTGVVPSPRIYYSSFMYDGCLYIFGGYDTTKESQLNDLLRFDPQRSEWTEMVANGSYAVPSCRHQCAVVGSKVFFIGGYWNLERLEDRSCDISTTDDECDTKADESGPVVLLNEAFRGWIPTDFIFYKGIKTYSHATFLLDMKPSLFTLCMLKVAENSLDISKVPPILREKRIPMDEDTDRKTFNKILGIFQHQ